MVRVEKAQAVPSSWLACDAHASGAVRNTAKCASNTTAVSTISRIVGRRVAAEDGGLGM